MAVATTMIWVPLQMAFSLINEVGGRVTVMQARLPNIGAGALKSRENKDGKTQNFGPATDFYKRLALESVGKQVSYDLFAIGRNASIDLATLGLFVKFYCKLMLTFSRDVKG